MKKPIGLVFHDPHWPEIFEQEARLSAESFYRHRGYTDMPFEDLNMQKSYIDLGKVL